MQVYLLNRRFQQHQEIIWRGRSAVQPHDLRGLDLREDARKDGADGRARLPDVRAAVPEHEQLHVQAERDRVPRRFAGVVGGADPHAQPRRQSKIELAYLEALHEGYEEFIQSISKVIPVIRIDYEKFTTAEQMAEVIKREYLDASFLRRAAAFDPTR